MEATVKHASVRKERQVGRLVAAAPSRRPAALPPDDFTSCPDNHRRRTRASASTTAAKVGGWGPARPSGRPRGGRRGFLDICSGVGHVAAHARAAGLAASEFEIRHGPQGDVLRKPVQARIRAAVRSRRTAGVMLASPCTSFTTARNRTRGPIRSKQRPRGLRHYAWGEPLRLVDRKALQLGNQ